MTTETRARRCGRPHFSWEDMARARLHRLRLPVSVHRSAAPSAGTGTSPSGSPRGGHEVTFLTLRQWDRGDEPTSPACASSPSGRGWSCTRGGRRRIAAAARVRPGRALASAAPRPPLRRRAHGVVSRTSRSWPRRVARRAADFRIVVDWHEVWTRDYWREYLGPRRRAARLARAARVPARAAARVLLLAAARAAAARARACAAS